jgi:hypothetical protein
MVAVHNLEYEMTVGLRTRIHPQAQQRLSFWHRSASVTREDFEVALDVV